MQDESITEILSKTEIAHGLGRADLNLVLAHSQVKTANPGEVVIAEGDPGEAGYVVLEGQLKVMLLAGGHPNRNADISMNTLRPGDCLGEYALIDSRPHSATVIAEQPSKLLELTRTTLVRFDSTHDRIAKVIYRNVLQILTRRLRKKDRELDFEWDIE